MRLLVRSLTAAFALLLVLTSGWFHFHRSQADAPYVMMLDQGHMNDNDWRLYWFVPELNYQRPFTDPRYDLLVIGWWQDWLYYTGNSGWFEDTTANQLRNVYRVRAGQTTPELVTRSIIRRGLIWLPEQNRMVYPAPTADNRTDLFLLTLADGSITNLTASVPKGINMRRIPLMSTSDGRWVLPYTADVETPHLLAVSTDGRQLVEVGRLDTTSKVNTPTGVGSVFQAQNGLFQIGSNGDVRLLSNNTEDQPIVAWLPQQGVMIAQSVFGQDVIAYSLDDGAVLWRVPGLYLTHPPDGEIIYVDESGGDVVQIEVQTGEMETIKRYVSLVWGWTPDGEWLVYQDGNADMRRLHHSTGQSVLIRPLANDYLYNIGPSPDGKWWLFLESTSTQTTLNRIRMDGSDEEQLLILESRRPQPTTIFAGWTPPFEKDWQPLFLGVLVIGCGLVIGSVRRRF